MSKEIVIDIETLPCSNPEQIAYLLDSVKADARLKDPAKIEADIAEKRAECIDKTGLDGSFGRVLMVSVSEVGSDEIYTTHGDCEEYVLNVLMDTLRDICNSGTITHRPVIIGHNVGWDLRFLAQRCAVNGVRVDRKLIPFDAKPWDGHYIDTMTAWAGVGNRINLDRLCHALGVKSPKGEMDGSQVATYYSEGRIDDIIKYNRADVTATKQCYQIMKQAGIV
jgi:hypothetical protein